MKIRVKNVIKLLKVLRILATQLKIKINNNNKNRKNIMNKIKSKIAFIHMK